MRVFLLIFVVCIISPCLSFAAETTAIVYVRAGDPSLDAVVPDLQLVVAKLNAGGNSHGHRYELVLQDTFTGAKSFNSNPPDHVSTVMLVAHGTYDSDGNFIHLLRDTRRDENFEPIRTPESEVEPYFVRSFYCGKNGRINSDEVGKEAARYNGSHPYRTEASVPPNGSGGSSGPVAGRYEYITYETWVWYVKSDGHLAAYRVDVTVAIWVWDGEDPYNQALA